MTRTYEFVETLVDYIEGRISDSIIGPIQGNKLVLGGGSGINGGSGIPWGGIVGQLLQTLVTYDTTEAATMTLRSGVGIGSGVSLLDNLNRIRWHSLPATWFESTPTLPRGLTITIGSGLWYPDAITPISYAGGLSPTFIPPVSNPRIDVVYVTTSGIVGISQGIEAASPTITIPSGVLPLSAVYMTPACVGIGWTNEFSTYSGYIYKDLRPFLNLGGITAGSGINLIPTRGDLIVANATPAWVNLPKGTWGRILYAGQFDIEWSNTIFSFGVNSYVTIDANTRLYLQGGGSDSIFRLPNAFIELAGGGVSCTLTLPNAAVALAGGGASCSLTLPNAAIVLAGGGAACTLTLPNAATTVTGGGTIALGGFTATVPITGTTAMGAGTCTVATANDVTVASHTHAITSSSNPGAAASVLASDTDGYLQLTGVGVNTAPTSVIGFNLFKNLTIPAATVYSGALYNVRATGNAAGTSILRATAYIGDVRGANNIAEATAVLCDVYNQMDGGTTLANQFAYVATVRVYTASNTTVAAAFRGSARIASSGEITSRWSAFEAWPITFDGGSTGVVAAAAGLYVNNLGHAQVTTAYGIYIASQSGAGANYAIYSAGGSSYHAGNFRFGASTYLNWGATEGTGGYGFRDNSGIMQYKNSGGSWTNFTSGAGSGYTGCDPALTSTSWDGDSYSTTAKTLIDLSAVFGVPAGIKGAIFQVSIRDSGSASAIDCVLILSPNNTAGQGEYLSIVGLPDDISRQMVMVIPCNADGDVYYQIVATGTNTMDVHLQIHGYYA